MPSIAEMYERVTRMTVDPRQPYAGQLVFAAFSGSHQDAIAKGLAWRAEHDPEHWTYPYLPIDSDRRRPHATKPTSSASTASPARAASATSWKQNFGYVLLQGMREELSYHHEGRVRPRA